MLSKTDRFDIGLELLEMPAFQELRPPEGWTLEVIGLVCGVSRERVRQVQSVALAKLRFAIAREEYATVRQRLERQLAESATQNE